MEDFTAFNKSKLSNTIYIADYIFLRLYQKNMQHWHFFILVENFTICLDIYYHQTADSCYAKSTVLPMMVDRRADF